MKIPFDIKFRPQIESGEYKVVTSFEEPAEIVKWDCKGQYPLLACIFDGDTDDAAFYTEEGKGVCNSKENYLFIITPEPGLTEFENAIVKIVKLCDGTCSSESDIKECIKSHSEELLELAMKSLAKQGYVTMSIGTFDENLNSSKEEGRKEALKDLPRWRKCDKNIIYNTKFSLVENGVGRFLMVEGYKIGIDSLEKLPGFNE